MEENPFIEYISRVRAGEEEALEELVSRYEPIIRLEARMRLRSPRLRSVLDSMDICQSVLKSFFQRAAAGQFSIDRPEDLRRLLVQMACNKSLEHVRREYAQRRDVRRSVTLGEEADTIAAEADPMAEAEWQELLIRGKQMLSLEEQTIAQHRQNGLTWDEIAAELGGKPDKHRMQLNRAIARVAASLGLEVSADV